ncbi:unnamed protein product [Caenorhabditis auriculariae]|uniref:U3 small nucleolar RNA-associated protein 15 homolog n=1 Tax=Caenorhabditis auriculariae TaxID=2777116 RepID=A0A8S1H691_9PELO|nr:unnamed protein product [Caenorhabditis auriculariae]
MTSTYFPAEKYLSRKQDAVIVDEDVIYWKRLQQLAVFQEPSTVSAVKVSPKKPFHVACTSSVRLTLYNRQLCEPMNLFSRFKKAVFSIDFRTDGRLLAIGGEEGKVRIFDVENTTGSSKAPLRVMQASQSNTRCVRFSTRGDTIFAMNDEGFLKQYDVADTAYGVNAKPIWELQAHEDAVRCGAVATLNDNVVLTGGYDHMVRIWDTRSQEKGLELNCEQPVEAAIFLPGDQLIATAAGNIVKIWDLTAGGRQLAALQAHYKTVTSLCLAKNGTCLVTAGIDRRVNFFRTTNYSLIHSMSMPSPVLALDVSPDDESMAVGMGNLLGIYQRAKLKKEVLAHAAATNKKALVRTSAPAVKLREKGQPKEKVEVVAKSEDKLNLPRVDRLLMGFQHAAAVRRMFKSELKFFSPAVAYLRIILVRNAMKRALAGQEPIVQKNLLKFLTTNMFKEEYFDTLRRVAEAFFEVYAEEPLEKEVQRQMLRLQQAVKREFEVQKMLTKSIGALEMIVAASKTNFKSDVQDQMDDVFGEPQISAVEVSLELQDDALEQKIE